MGGSYLSRPVKKTVSAIESNDKLSYGASSMQGWRSTQEDAHNCILDFDDDISFFAVYDGHGGSEVAIYTSQELPNFLKNTKNYEKCFYKEALIEAFLGFDDTIPSQEVLDKLKDIRDQELMRSRAERQEKRNRLRSSSSSSVDKVEENETNEEVEEEEEEEDEEEEEEFESAEVLRREASRPVEEVVAAYKQGTSIRGSLDEAGSSSSAGCSSSCQSSSAAGSSSAGSSCAESNTSGHSSSAGGAAGDADCSSTSATASSSIDSKNVNLANGSVSEESVMNGGFINGDINDELKDEKLTKRIPKEVVTTINDQPGTSPKKKKLALSDLDDSTVVKNFIANDEISESDEDDSEDETFELTNNDLDNDKENDDDDEDDDDDDDDDDEDDDSDSEIEKGKFVLNRNTLVQQLTKHLRRNHGIIVEDSDDSDDDVDENGGEEDESANESKSDEKDEGEEEEEDIEEEDIEDEEDGVNDDDGEQPGVDSGCTAVIALIKGDELYVANAGDSRCILCKNGVAVDMSDDHKPENPLEWARVEKAGGRVSVGRVQGVLNLSRAIGDHRYKKNTELPNTEQMITALPDVRVAKLEPDVEFIVLACDGIWNSLSSQEVVNFIRPRMKSNKSLSEICEELFHECLAPDTSYHMCDGTGCDNMTCIIVKPLRGGANDNTSSNVGENGSQVSNNIEEDSTVAEKGTPNNVDSVEKPQNAVCEDHEEEAATTKITPKQLGTDVPLNEMAACSKRPSDSSDEVARKKFKTDDDVFVDDSSCVDTTSV